MGLKNLNLRLLLRQRTLQSQGAALLGLPHLLRYGTVPDTWAAEPLGGLFGTPRAARSSRFGNVADERPNHRGNGEAG